MKRWLARLFGAAPAGPVDHIPSKYTNAKANPGYQTEQSRLTAPHN